LIDFFSAHLERERQFVLYVFLFPFSLLSMKYSGAILAQSAELLVRWVTSLAMLEGAREGGHSYHNLFLRAGQV
jgi:hypothetical protein